MINQQAKFISDDRGATAIEFALIAVVFLTLLFGIMEAGRIFWTQNALQYSAEKATRVALVNDDLTEGEIETLADGFLQEMLVSPNNVTTAVNFVIIDGTEYLEIESTYTYDSLVKVLLPAGLDNFELSAYSRRPMAWNN